MEAVSRTTKSLRDILRKLGLRSIAELRGRRDLLRYIPEEFEA